MTRIFFAWLGLVTSGLAQAQEQATPPVDAFARLPAAQFMSLSPDGTKLAYISQTQSSMLGVVRDISTGEERGVGVQGYRPRGLTWIDDERLLLRVDQVVMSNLTRGDIDFGVAYTVDVDDMQGREFLRSAGMPSGSRVIALYPSTARLVGRSSRPGELLMSMTAETGHHHLFSVNAESGRPDRVARGSTETAYWTANPTGDRYAEFAYDSGSNTYRIELHENGRSRVVTEATEPMISLSVAGFTQDGGSLLLTRATVEPPFTRLVQTLSLADGAMGEVLFQDEQFDFETLRRDWNTGELVGIGIERERYETIWFDQGLAQIESDLQDAFGETARISLQNWSADRSRFIVRAEPPDQAAIFYLFDRARGAVEPVRASYPELLAHELPQRTPFTYTARDGAEIPGYITRPQGQGPHPYVLLVHGGPASRDYGGFDYFAHFLASRGFGVIQPNFRGSGGFGQAWEQAGLGEWGLGVMQTDVEDAARAVREQGLASSVCIAGLSYGGYAALAGVTLTPQAYDCAVAVNAVTGLRRHVRYVDGRFGGESQAARYWRLSMTGDMSGDELNAVDAERAPVNHADAVQVPVLLIHGDDDTVVEVWHSREMARALERAGAQHEYLELDGGDHWLLEYQTRLQVLQAMEAFLARHNR